MRGPSKATIQKVIKAAHDCHGNVLTMSSVLAIDRSTIYNYIHKFPEVKEAVEQGQNDFYEFCVSRMQQLIDQGDTRMISLFLKCSPAAHRKGWGERAMIQADNTMTEAEKSAYVKNMIGLQDDSDGEIQEDNQK